jgi:CRP-like cAMP-binding protein
VKEGQKATHMYILEQGNCEVLVKGSLTKKEQFVRDLGPGSMFGELALLHGNRRTASVRSKDCCTVGCLNEESFNQLIKNFPEIKNRFKEYGKSYTDEWRAYKVKVLKNVNFLQLAPESTLDNLMYKLQIGNYESGAKIFSKGTECEFIYFIVTGELELYVEQGKKEFQLEVIGPGSILGQYSILKNAKFEFCARAKQNLKMLYLNRNDLMDLANNDSKLQLALTKAHVYILTYQIPVCDYCLHTGENTPEMNEDPMQIIKSRKTLTIRERFAKAVNKVMVLNRTKLHATHKFLDLLDQVRE